MRQRSTAYFFLFFKSKTPLFDIKISTMGVLDLLLLSTAVVCSTGKLVTFDNTKPRLDSTGAIINAHDGTTQVSTNVNTS